MPEPIRLFVCGDVMTGRGIDQILPHPSEPQLFERYMYDARGYVALAEAAYGRIPHPVSYDYVWGDAREEWARAGADCRIVNLETSITTSDDRWPGKEVHYRMHPANVGCLTAAGIDCCALANNHTLDWGYEGLAETLATLDGAGIHHAGAGANATEAQAPAVLDVPGKGRVLVFSFGSETSGIPQSWGAAEGRPGVNRLTDLSAETGARTAAAMRERRKPGDLLIASIHWGSNWGYEIPEAQIAFARRLIEDGVDLVHGHSSHHIKAFAWYRGRVGRGAGAGFGPPRPILYGCGDFLTDYEGIGGYEEFRGDLAAMYFITLAPAANEEVPPTERPYGKVEPPSLRLVPLQVRHFRLRRASASDSRWLWRMLQREGTPFGTEVSFLADGTLTSRPPRRRGE